MPKYHFSPKTGKAEICRAEKRPCQYGSPIECSNRQEANINTAIQKAEFNMENDKVLDLNELQKMSDKELDIYKNNLYSCIQKQEQEEKQKIREKMEELGKKYPETNVPYYKERLSGKVKISEKNLEKLRAKFPIVEENYKNYQKEFKKFKEDFNANRKKINTSNIYRQEDIIKKEEYFRKIEKENNVSLSRSPVKFEEVKDKITKDKNGYINNLYYKNTTQLYRIGTIDGNKIYGMPKAYELKEGKTIGWQMNESISSVHQADFGPAADGKQRLIENEEVYLAKKKK